MISYLSKGFYGKSISYQPLPNKTADDINELNDLTDHTKSVNRFSPQNTYRQIEEIYVLSIKDGQTIQSIALKYNCSLWDLNRLNNLISSQDFHSLKEIKISSTKDSYRSELLKNDGAQLLSEKPITENGAIVKQPNPIVFDNLELNDEKSNDSSRSSVDIILSSPTFNASNFILSQSKKKSSNSLCGSKWLQITCALFLCLFLIPAIVIITFIFSK